MPSAAAMPSRREVQTAVRATITKLGPGLPTPRVSAPRKPNRAVMSCMIRLNLQKAFDPQISPINADGSGCYLATPYHLVDEPCMLSEPGSIFLEPAPCRGDSPIVVAFPPLLTIVRDFEAHAIGIGEEGGPVISSVLGVELGLGGVDAQTAQPGGYRDDIGRRIDAQAEVVQPRSVGIVRAPATRRAQHIAEVAIEVLDV